MTVRSFMDVHYLEQLGRKYQSLKGAVGVTVCQNEAELKFSMEILELDCLFNSGERLSVCLILAEGHNNCSPKLCPDKLSWWCSIESVGQASMLSYDRQYEERLLTVS